MIDVLTSVALAIALVFCALKTVAELRAGRLWWALAGWVGTIGIAAVPFTDTVEIRFEKRVIEG